MPKRILQGMVVSDKNDKTIVVEVERRYTHPLFKKTVRRTKKYHAHDEKNVHKIGDKVPIEETVTDLAQQTLDRGREERHERLSRSRPLPAMTSGTEFNGAQGPPGREGRTR